ncbi:hypothetical protein [Halobacteriovorax sp. HLS]|uniref:hypothetical protein n=1 Tax=Halobacteriovorax sp. HLS TaxID=2234000 RepID=UPI000FD7A90F|nr:hypothetical protein [Halobacteriovorax sp. HLS]
MLSLRNIRYLALLIVSIPCAHAGLEGSFSFETFQRLNNPSEKTEAVNWSGLSLGYKDTTRDSEVQAEGSFRYYFSGPKSLNYSVPSLYYSAFTEDSTWTFGRKVVNWSPNEKYWLLGNLNPRQGYTLLSSKQEGLTGLHYTKEMSKEASLDIFFSYFYIPTMNPSVDIQDGEVVSTSEWMRMPPKKTIILDQVVPIYYDMNRPTNSDIIFQKSMGISSKYKWTGGNVSAYAIYKPESSLRSNAEASLSSDGSQVLVTANPIVNHHLIYGMQTSQKFGDVLGVISFDVTDPNAKLGDDFEVLNPLQLKDNDRVFESEYFSIEPSYDKESYLTFSAQVDRPFYSLSMNYIKLMSENSRGSDDFFSETVKWKSTIGTMAKVMWTDQFFTLLDYRLDFERKDQIIRMEGDYIFNRSLGVRLGVELIKSPEINSYWSAYRANDTVYTSLNYLF